MTDENRGGSPAKKAGMLDGKFWLFILMAVAVIAIGGIALS
jgi:hypothetical protein